MPYNLDIKGWMSETELIRLSILSDQVPENGVIVEIGSFVGLSSVCLAMSAKKSVNIYCYDMFNTAIYRNGNEPVTEVDSWKEFIENTKDFSNVIPVKGFCPIDTKYADPRPIDLLFIDAAHRNPEDWNIIEYFLPFMSPTGVLSGHDYSTDPAHFPFPDVIVNVERLERMYNKRATIGANGSDRIWSIRLV